MSWRDKLDVLFGMPRPRNPKATEEAIKTVSEEPEPVKEPTKITIELANGGMLLLECPHRDGKVCDECWDKVKPILQAWFDTTFIKQQESGWTNKDVTQPFVMR